jgi:RHS repeat-associated protein
MLAIQDGATLWVHQEPVTKGQRLTDTSGNVVSTIEVDPFGGESLRMVNQLRQPHRYTTYERDGNGGDEAMYRRYEGRWQRFAQPDPYDGSYNLTDPQSLNRYAYVQNDPVNFTDPSGLEDCPDCWNPEDDPEIIFGGAASAYDWSYADAKP